MLCTKVNNVIIIKYGKIWTWCTAHKIIWEDQYTKDHVIISWILDELYGLIGDASLVDFLSDVILWNGYTGI